VVAPRLASLLLMKSMHQRERMGSGGPRGLQILRSGANTVRGGFDSHAFPPNILVALLLLGWLLAGVATAEGGEVRRFAASPGLLLQDEQQPGAPAESVDGGGEPIERRPQPEQVIVKLSPKKPRYFDAPGWVMLRSAIVPGWGQFHNGAWIKGLAIVGLEAWVGLKLLDDQRELDDLSALADEARRNGDTVLEDAAIEQYNAKLDTFIGRQWLMGGLIGYALLDAYIDAHFRDFDVGFRGDPALPEGKPDAGKGGGKLFLRWRF